MRKSALVLTAIAAAATAVAPAAARPRLTGEQELAKLIDGRVAGKPSSCISTFSRGNLRVLDGTALVYDAGRTIWVNRPNDARSLDDDDILITQNTMGGQLCRLDIVRTIDRTGYFPTGFISLGDFVPYRKAG
jgi:hypothetical protein